MNRLLVLSLLSTVVFNFSSQSSFASVESPGELSSSVVTLERHSDSLQEMVVTLPFDLRNLETGEITHEMDKRILFDRLRPRKVLKGFLFPHRVTRYVHVKEHAHVRVSAIRVRIVFPEDADLIGSESEQVRVSLGGTDTSPLVQVEVLGRNKYEAFQQTYKGRDVISVKLKLKEPGQV